MFGDDATEWCDAIFRRADGDESHQIFIFAGRAPGVVRLPIDEDWFEQFRIDAWEEGRPVFVPMGFVPRE